MRQSLPRQSTSSHTFARNLIVLAAAAWMAASIGTIFAADAPVKKPATVAGPGKVIDFTTEQMSVDLPAPADMINLQYSDIAARLPFDTKADKDEIFTFYRRTLAPAGWEATTETLFRSDGKVNLEFTVGAGKAKAVAEGLRKQLTKGDWREMKAVLEEMAGTLIFSKDSQTLTIVYVDTGIMPAEITISGPGVEVEK